MTVRKLIPSPLIAVVAEIASSRETHASLDSLFMYAGAPGDPPDGSKLVKAQEWLRRLNTNESTQPLQVLGRLIEGYMEEVCLESDRLRSSGPSGQLSDREKLTRTLELCELQYVRGGLVVGALGAPSRTLEEFIRENDLSSLDHEFKRALENVNNDPREAVSAASNILETLCKVYIEEQALEMPAKKDLKPVWNIVRQDLKFDPGKVEDNDLKTILSGLLALVEGIGSLRSHASSAHGAGKRPYKLEPRHARLAVHSAHTVALFVLESWERRKK